MTSSADLFALQEVDLRRDSRRAYIADIEARLGETDELRAANERAAEAKAEVDRLQKQQHEIDTQLEDLDAKARPLEKKLYDGSVHNPKDLTDMQHELDSFKARRNKLEDDGLSLIEALESANNALAGAQSELDKIEMAWREDQEELAESKEVAEAESARLLADRELRAKGMDASAIGMYEKLRVMKQGKAVARIERTACSGCRISLPTHLVQQVRGGMTLVQCPNCERILVAG